MPSAPAVSVAMSVYNNAPFLRAAIESILDQSFGDFEFLIVDDGSTDGSGEIIDSYAARDPRIRVLRQENRGLVASLNRLIAEARAPLIARMDGDDISRPDRFEQQVAFLAAHPDHGVLGAWASGIDEQGRDCDNGLPGQPTTAEAFIAALNDSVLMCHPAVMMRTKLVRAVGGYRAVYRHCEDYDLWLRLAECTKLCSLPERLLLYRYSASQVSSRHALPQAIGASIAWFAHLERAAGRPDPTDGLTELPSVAALDQLFGRPGIGKAVREMAALRVVYSDVAMAGEGYHMLLAHVRGGGRREGLWKTTARLVRFGLPWRAVRLASVLTLTMLPE